MIDIAQLMLKHIPESTSNIIVSDEDSTGKPIIINVKKIEKYFGLRFDGRDDLEDHVIWNVARAREKLSGKELPDVTHVW